MRKFCTVLVMALLLITTISSNSVFASEKEKVNVKNDVLMCDCGVPFKEHLEHLKNKLGVYSLTSEDITRSIICDCGGKILSSSTYTSWKYTGDRRICSTHRIGSQSEQKRTKTTEYSCTNCSVGWDSVSTQTRWIHIGCMN